MILVCFVYDRETERGKERQRERETDRDRKWEVRREKQGNE